MTDKDTAKNKNIREYPCLVCNNSDFEWGSLLVGETLDEKRSHIFFRPEGSEFEDGDIPTYVRRCNVCGNILLFTIEN